MDVRCLVSFMCNWIYSAQFLASAVLQVAWNPNLGSHQWLAVGGNAGLLRILRVESAASRATAARCESLLNAELSANGPG